MSFSFNLYKNPNVMLKMYLAIKINVKVAVWGIHNANNLS